MAKYKYFSLIALLLAYSTGANALLFDVPATDRSLYYLGMIFGPVGNLPLSGTDMIMGTLFTQFNKIFITLTTLILGYIIIVSVMQTAQEGKVLGEKWSNMIIPIRAALGIFLLIPDVTGYSNIQKLFMWIILSGVGGANVVWTQMLAFVEKHGGIDDSVAEQTANSGIMVINADGTPVPINSRLGNYTTRMLGQLVCQQMLVNNNSRAVQSPFPPIPTLKNRTIEASVGVSEEEIQFTVLAEDPINDGKTLETKAISVQCGGIGLHPIENRVKLSMDKQKLDPLKTPLVVEQLQNRLLSEIYDIYMGLENIAKDYYQTVVQGQIIRSGASTPFASAYLKSIQFYTEEMDNFVPSILIAQSQLIETFSWLIPGQKFDDAVASIAGGSTDILQTSFAERARDDGWIHGGAYYFSLIKPTQALTAARENVGVTAADIEGRYLPALDSPSTLPPSDGIFEGFLASLHLPDNAPEGNQIASFMQQSSIFSTMLLGGKMPEVEPIDLGKNVVSSANKSLAAFDHLNTFRGKLLKFMEKDLVNSKDYLTSLSKFGAECIIAAEIIYLMTAVAIGISLLASAVGAGCQGMGQAIDLVTQLVSGLISICIGLLWTSGALLVFYLPLIPFLFYTFAAVGWIIAVIEAMVAAPLVAMFVAMPSEDELGKSHHSIIILMHAFLKPALIVISFIIASRVLNVVLEMLVVSMVPAIRSSAGNTGFFGAFAVMFTFTSFVVMLVNKAFAIIYTLPDAVIRWIGGHGDGYGEGADALEGKFSSISQKTSDKAGQSLQSGMATAGQSMNKK